MNSEDPFACVCCSNNEKKNFNYDIPICNDCVSQQIDFSKRFHPKYNNPEIDKITDRIYLGNADASRRKDILKNHGITHILVTGAFLECCFAEDFVYHQIDIISSSTLEISKYFEECFKFIDKSERVFVHCAAGLHRSPTIVIGYLMITENQTLEEAFSFVKEKRTRINPPTNYIDQLRSLEKEKN